MPRLCAPGHRVLPLHEHPGALLHRLSRRYRHRAAVRARWISRRWFEAYLGDRWYTFDARNNTPRIGRVLIARGRDAMRCGARQHIRPEHARRFQGLDRRGCSG